MENNENLTMKSDELVEKFENEELNESVENNNQEEIIDESANEFDENLNEDIDGEEEKYDDEGELSDESSNEVGVKGNSNTTIVGSNVNLGNIQEDDDTHFPCLRCSTELDANRYGIIICSKCGQKNYRRNPKLEITQFETIKDQNASENYLNVIARINNNYIRKKYTEAFKYCLEAETIAPREPTTWEYFTLLEFFKEISQSKDKRKEINDILKIVKNNIKICEANNVAIDKIEELKGEIAIYLFNSAKARIGTYYHNSKKQNKYWSKIGRRATIHQLDVFSQCYYLTKDVFYLKGYVDELSKPYKWIVKSLSGDLINLPSCGKKFNALAQRERVISKIKKIESDYEIPDVETERLKISIQNEDNNNNDIINISFQ